MSRFCMAQPCAHAAGIKRKLTFQDSNCTTTTEDRGRSAYPATAPLAILFETHARQAWVGNLMKQLADAQGRILSAADLDALQGVTKPRSKEQKKELHFGSVDSLSFSKTLIRAASLANVGLSEVLVQYGKRTCALIPEHS